jgi:predicted  nucleic acid-binding Zn-ribbon protein
MNYPLDQALGHLNAALGQLEAAAQRKLDHDRRRGDFETELTLMQDDRARLAMELDGALTRVQGVEALAADSLKRVEAAMAVIRDVIAEAEG